MSELKPESVMRVEWDIVPHDDHCITPDERDQITQSMDKHMSEMGYCCGGWGSIGEVGILEDDNNKLRSEVKRLAKVVALIDDKLDWEVLECTTEDADVIRDGAERARRILEEVRGEE